ncbi:MAG: hypothetical protein WCG05_03655 [Alphaproteobacteria bacterium]
MKIQTLIAFLFFSIGQSASAHGWDADLADVTVILQSRGYQADEWFLDGLWEGGLQTIAQIREAPDDLIFKLVSPPAYRTRLPVNLFQSVLDFFQRGRKLPTYAESEIEHTFWLQVRARETSEEQCTYYFIR